MKYALASDFASSKRKRRRLHGSRRSVRAKKEEEEGEQVTARVVPTMYFDNLPDNVLENIVRYRSKSPRARNWPSYIPAELLLRLFKAGGDLGQFCRTRFTAMCVSDTKCVYDLDKDVSWSRRTREMLWARNKRTAYDVVLNAGGDLKTLFIGPSYAKILHNGDMLDVISSKCTSVNALSIESDGRAWIERFGPRLISLELGLDPSRSAFFAIQNYCTNLLHLTMNAVHRSDMARQNTSDVTNLWQKIGKTLVKLDVAFHFPCAGEIAKIEKHCRKLRELHIEEEEGINPALAKCLASYGNQLEAATLSDMNADQLKQVVSACTRAKFSLYVEDAQLVPTLNILGAQLDTAYVKFSVFDDEQPLIQAWDRCTNLRKLHVLSDCTHDDMKRVFHAAKTNLKIIWLCIGLPYNGENVKAIMDTVAQGTCELENMSVQCINPPVGTFDQLVARNSASLKNVRIYTHNAMNDDTACDVVEKFLTGTRTDQLCELHVSDVDNARKSRFFIPRIRDFCARAQNRHRRVRVQVLGYPYLR